jgi:2,3-diphosphopglycerate-independent phosphoglycerate mutase
MTPMKVLLCLVDGLGDYSHRDLDGKTPLQAARISTLDELAASGINGLMDPVSPGLACGSDTAHLALFGYDPRKWYRGRGAFEAIGAGLEMEAGDVAFKCNFAYSESPGIVTRRRVDRHFEREGPILCAMLNGVTIPGFPDITVRCQYATEHRCGVVFHSQGSALSDAIGGIDPLKDNLPLLSATPLNTSSNDPAALRTAAAVNAFAGYAARQLAAHPLSLTRQKEGKNPCNCILLRGPASPLAVPPMESNGGYLCTSRGAHCIGACRMVLGLCENLHFTREIPPGATGDMDSNLQAKAAAAIRTLKQSDGPSFIFLHVKGMDDAGHDGLLNERIRMIEAVDSMLRTIIDALEEEAKEEGEREEEVLIIVTGDHSTPTIAKDHSCEPVPICLALRGSRNHNHNHSSFHSSSASASASSLAAIYQDDVRNFDEVAASTGSLGRFPALQLLPLIDKIVSNVSSSSSSTSSTSSTLH